MPRNLNARFPRRDTFRRGGFSLLEVAIALVIFVIGALAIVRIFPGALNVVQGSGNRNLAVNLNRGTLSKFAQEAGSVPRAIYNHNPADTNYTDGVAWLDFEGSVAGTPRRNYSIPRSNISDIGNSALGKFQYIFEEGQKVRGQGTNLFLMTNHAIRPSSNVIVSEEDIVEGITIDVNGVLNFSDAHFRNADIPLSAGTQNPVAPYFDNTSANPTNDIDYYITYRYNRTVAGQNRVEHVQDELVSDTSGWGTSPQVPGLSNVVPGLVEVRFVHKFVPTPSNSTESLAGHFQISTTTAPTLLTKARSLTPNDNVRVSYVCDAWNWLINDEVATQPQEGGNLNAVLPVKFIDSEPAAFYPTATTVGAAYGFRQSYDAVTGDLELESGSYSEGGTPNGIFENAPANSAKALRDAFNAGRIFVDELLKNGTQENTSPSLRVSYRTRDAWAHQVSVAPSTYIRWRGSTSPQPWRLFAVGSDNFLYFPPSEAGKTLLISYVGTEKPNATDPAVEVEQTAKVITIDEDIISASSAPANVAGFAGASGRLSKARLTKRNEEDYSAVAAEGEGITRIISIKGLSVQIRTAWLEGSRFTQSSLTGFRQEAGSQ